MHMANSHARFSTLKLVSILPTENRVTRVVSWTMMDANDLVAVLVAIVVCELSRYDVSAGGCQSTAHWTVPVAPVHRRASQPSHCGLWIGSSIEKSLVSSAVHCQQGDTSSTSAVMLLQPCSGQHIDALPVSQALLHLHSSATCQGLSSMVSHCLKWLLRHAQHTCGVLSLLQLQNSFFSPVSSCQPSTLHSSVAWGWVNLH